MKINKGLATWAGLVAAIGQYVGAIALFLEADDQALALGPLATATATLWKVIEGRMNQATAQIEAQTAKPAAPSSYALTSSTGSGAYVTSTFTQPRPGAELRTPDLGTPRDPAQEIPGGSVPVPTIDDPGNPQ